MKPLSIKKIDYLKDYKLKIYFNDEKIQIVDFEPFLKAAKHPEIKKYLDLSLFKNYEVTDGDLSWQDFDLIFPIADLYNNSILKYKNQDTEAS